MIQWRWQTFDELTSRQLHAILQLRQAVFVVEQQCPYPDIDGLDLSAIHLSAWLQSHSSQSLAAYLRLMPNQPSPGVICIGRVLTHPNHRRQGLGTQLMSEALCRIQQHWPEHGLQLSAQEHLQAFYEQFGFQRASDMYLEDGIPHIKMIREPNHDEHSYQNPMTSGQDPT